MSPIDLHDYCVSHQIPTVRWIEKDCGGSFKRDPMLANVLPRFDRVPFKSVLKWFSHEAIIS